MRIIADTTVDFEIFGMTAMCASEYRTMSDRDVVWEKARSIQEDILCISREDFGNIRREGGPVKTFRSGFILHTAENPCSCSSPEMCEDKIVRMFGCRNGILSGKPGHLSWDGTNIPAINKLRSIPTRVKFPLHGSYVDVPGYELEPQRQ